MRLSGDEVFDRTAITSEMGKTTTTMMNNNKKNNNTRTCEVRNNKSTADFVVVARTQTQAMSVHRTIRN